MCCDKIPTAWLSIADQCTVLVLIPLFDSLVYPYIGRTFTAGSQMSIHTRLVVGMSLSALSVIAAGALETMRLATIYQEGRVVTKQDQQPSRTTSATTTTCSLSINVD